MTNCDSEYLINCDILSEYHYWWQYKIAYWLSNGVLTFDLSHGKGQSQGQANFDCQYRISGDR